MQCEEFRHQFPDYLIGAVEASRCAALEQHLASCLACRWEADASRELWSGLRALPSETPDSAMMRARFHTMLAAYAQGVEAATAAPADFWRRADRWLGSWWPRRPLWQFGLALALLAAGGMAGAALRATPETAEDVRELRAEVSEMRQMVVLSLIRQESASERLRAVSWSNRLDQPGDAVLTALLETLRHDPNVNVRLAAVDALQRFAESQEVRQGALRALTEQESPLLQVALIDFMVAAREPESVEALRGLTQNPAADEAVRQRAAWGLEQFQQ